jgi:hypothetical protein
LSTLETVPGDTPASCATSRTVGGDDTLRGGTSLLLIQVLPGANKKYHNLDLWAARN